MYLVVSIFLVISAILGFLLPILPIWLTLFLAVPVIFTLLLSNQQRLGWVEKQIVWLLPSYIFLSIAWPRYLSLKIGGPDITPTRIVAMVLIALWMLAMTGQGYRQIFSDSLKKHSIYFSLIGIMVFWHVLASITSDALANSLYQLANELFTVIIVVLIGSTAIRSKADVRRLVGYILMATLIVLVVGIVEKIKGSNPFETLIPPGLKLSNEFIEQALAAKVRGGAYRLQATFAHPLLFVEFIVFALPILAYLIVAKNSIAIKIAASLAGSGLLALSVFTGSRSAIVAIVLVVFFAFLFQTIRWIRQGHLPKLVLGVSFGLPILLIVSVVVVEYLGLDSRLIVGRSVNEAQSSAARVQMLVQGIPLILEHPMLGYGLGLSGITLGFVGGGQITIDNYYLSLALDAGLPGLLIFMGICTLAIFKAVSIGGSRDPEISQLGIFMAISIIGMLTVKAILSIPYNLPLLFLATIVIVKMSDIRLEK